MSGTSRAGNGDQIRLSARNAAWERLLDAVVVIVAVAEMVRQVAEGMYAGEVALLIAACGAVAIQRRFPRAAGAMAVLVAGSALAVPQAAFVIWVTAQVVLLHVAMRSSRRAALGTAAVLGAVLYLGSVLVLDMHPVDPSALLLLTWTAAVLGAGLTVRAHRDRLDAVAQTAAAIVAARDSDIERHVADERLRIARELHDSVAHSIAVISVHAGAAAQALPGRPDDAGRAVVEIQTASRTVLADMQQIVHFLREGEDADQSSLVVSTPRGLVETARVLGGRIDAEVPDDSAFAALEPIVASTLARVVQEGLTNARKHGTGFARLAVLLDRRRVVVTLENDRPSSARADTASRSSGFGLIGMRERVTATGGSLEVRETDTHFTLRAELPRATSGDIR